MNIPALLNTLGSRSWTLPIVILYVTEGCNMRCITCSYRNAPPGELSLDEIRQIAGQLTGRGLRQIVFSGGEPLTRRDFPEICRLFHGLGVHGTLLTNGLLLEKRYHEVGTYLREIIVSLDGPNEEIHDAIRGCESFRRILRGIRDVVASPGRPQVSIRTVIQKRNFRSIITMVDFARELGVDRISFLAADVLSGSFGRKGAGSPSSYDGVTLSQDETAEFRTLVAHMASQCAAEFRSGFIAESPEKINRMAAYYEALLGKSPFPPTHCNAPMVSTVITSTGELLPCFFLPAFARLREGPIAHLLNRAQIRDTREAVRNGTQERCKTCVCTLHVSPASALGGRF